MTATTARRDAGWLLGGAPELITRSAVAEILGLDRRQVDHLVQDRVLTTVPVGRRRLVPRTGVLRMLGLPVPGESTPTD
jgi:excisionase family DNA binding protein